MSDETFRPHILRSSLLLLWLIPWLLVSVTWLQSQRRHWKLATWVPPTPGRSFLSASGEFHIITWSAPIPAASVSRQGISTWPATGEFKGMHLEGRRIDPLGICGRAQGVHVINAKAWRLNEIHVNYKPLWWIAALGFIPCVSGFRRLRRQWKLSRQGLCPQCGYDLRATPDRCPGMRNGGTANAFPTPALNSDRYSPAATGNGDRGTESVLENPSPQRLHPCSSEFIGGKNS